MLKLWEVDDGEQYWYSAETRERALELHLEPLKNSDGTYGELPCSIEEMEVTELSPETVLPVRQDDAEVVRKTAAEWANEGEGFVATTAC